MSRAATRSLLRRKLAPLSLAWAVAWLVGLSSLAWLALDLFVAKEDRRLEDEMSLYAMALYGMAWFDQDATFHGHLLTKEPLIRDAPFDLWVVRPGPDGLRHDLRPRPQRFTTPDFTALTPTVLDGARDTWHTLPAAGDEHIVFATPAFGEHDDQRPVAIIAVVASYAATRTAVERFRRRLLSGVAVLGLVGLLVGVALSWWSLAPAIASLRQRERFLAGAAHELRTPIATLGSIVDGARSGTEPAEQAIARLGPILDETSDLVSDLLLFARLESSHEAVRREPVRLDLLVEAAVPEHAEQAVHLDLPPTTVSADPRLASVAIRNLLANARQHGGGEVHVSPTRGGIVVHDQGPGYPQAVLAASLHHEIRFLPSTGGIGAGLALVQLIARLHGGSLTLGNHPGGGARAELTLGD